jgi:hypothetical protein
MPGTPTLPSEDELQLIGATLEGEQVRIQLSDGLTAAIPLDFLYRLNADYPLPAEAELLVLTTAPEIEHVLVSDTALVVYLKDGRVLSAPLAWFPRLVLATPAERNQIELRGDNQVIHWPLLDEDVDLEGLLLGAKSRESLASIQRWLATRQPPVDDSAEPAAVGSTPTPSR